MAHNKVLEDYKNFLLDTIHKYIPNCKVYLFGSRARKTHLGGADIDLAFDAGKSVDYHLVFKILGDIEDSDIPVFVDIVDFNAVSEVMKDQIKKDGILWKK